MKILYYECFAGISGDMHLAALLGLGVDEEWLRAELARLPIAEPWEFRVRPGQKSGIAGLSVEVLENPPARGHEHAHPHRHLGEMEDLIRAAAFSPRVTERSLTALRALAAAEAEVHGMDIQAVTLHEVSGLDTIIDLVGAALCLEYLAAEEIWSSPVELGGGFVSCAHGVLPVPAPAVQNLLRGVPVTLGRVTAETTTPTGAAVVKTFVGRFPSRPAFVPRRTAYGLGSRDLSVPNALRVTLADAAPVGAPDAEAFYEHAAQYVIETNIDDMSGEVLAYAEELLLRAGALDVWRLPCQMKKG
ncbi:MAG: nickel pincer cofactor biosynthesis protein LarC, partial [Gracilibacteraceae bacterium]|nr:nickel pincer cofactor biosynthesis protein LarC [Gracilibacteraceae bacterium]